MVTKIAVTLDQKTVADLGRRVREGRYPNRSGVLQSAADMLSEREKRSRLTRELAKLKRGWRNRGWGTLRGRNLKGAADDFSGMGELVG